MFRKSEPTEIQKCDIIIDYLRNELEGLNSLNEQGQFMTSEEVAQTLEFMRRFQETKKRVLTRYPSAQKL